MKTKTIDQLARLDVDLVLKHGDITVRRFAEQFDAQTDLCDDGHEGQLTARFSALDGRVQFEVTSKTEFSFGSIVDVNFICIARCGLHVFRGDAKKLETAIERCSRKLHESGVIKHRLPEDRDASADNLEPDDSDDLS